MTSTQIHRCILTIQVAERNSHQVHHPAGPMRSRWVSVKCFQWDPIEISDIQKLPRYQELSQGQWLKISARRLPKSIYFDLKAEYVDYETIQLLR